MSNSVFLNPMEQELVELDRGLLAMIERYRHAEEQLEGDQKRPLVEAIRSRLQRLENEHEDFRQALKGRDLLPHAPETDLEDIKRLAASIRAWIESDQTQALLHWLLETEQAWQETLQNVESSELPNRRIKTLQESSEAAMTALSGYRDSD